MIGPILAIIIVLAGLVYLWWSGRRFDRKLHGVYMADSAVSAEETADEPISEVVEDDAEARGPPPTLTQDGAGITLSLNDLMHRRLTAYYGTPGLSLNDLLSRWRSEHP